MADFVEGQNIETQAANPVETQGKKKSAKDFTPEEKAAILARAERIEFSRVAKEFGTTWQTVSAIRKQAKKEATQKVDTEAKKIKVEEKAKPNPQPSATGNKRSKDFTAEDKLKVLQRAAEIGLSRAAREASISRWVLMQWEKKAIAQNPDLQLNIKHSKRSKPSSVKQAVEPKQPVVAVAVKTNDNLEVENAILKEKVAALTEQLEKLRAAVANLA